MAYKKHIWVARKGSKLNRFLKYNETATSVELVNSPETVTQEGTPFSAQIMNEIEEEMERSSIAQETINADYTAIKAEQSAIETEQAAIRESLKGIVYGGRLRKASLLDIFGVTDPQKAIQYSTSQKEAVCSGDYVDLDAFSFTDDVSGSTINVTKTGNNSRIRVAGNPSPYFNSGDTANPDGIMWEFQNMPFTRAMNANNKNEGAYQGSEVYKLLNGNFATALQAVLGSSNTIKTTRRLEPTTNADDYGSWAWQSEKTFLLTETEVLGCKNVGAKKFQMGNMWQLPIYALDPSCRVKFYNGSRMWWWLASAYTIDGNNGWNSSCFASVGYGGGAGWSYAHTVGGVSPAFII